MFVKDGFIYQKTFFYDVKHINIKHCQDVKNLKPIDEKFCSKNDLEKAYMVATSDIKHWNL